MKFTDSKEYDKPPIQKNVWMNDICPAYTPRTGSLDSIKSCWYCRYADFHLTEQSSLEYGICCWPKKIID